MGIVYKTAPDNRSENPHGEFPKPCLFNPHPPKKKPSGWRAHGWRSQAGWNSEANRERAILLLNAEFRSLALAGIDPESRLLAPVTAAEFIDLPPAYTAEITVSLLAELTEGEIKAEWQRIRRCLQRLGVACYVRPEPTTQNRIHWHLTIAQPIPAEPSTIPILQKSTRTHPTIDTIRTKLKGIIKTPNRIESQPIYNTVGWLSYMLKAKPQGRVYFAEDVALRHTGTVGKFWILPKARLTEIWRLRCKAYNEQAAAAYLVQHPALKAQIVAYVQAAAALTAEAVESASTSHDDGEAILKMAFACMKKSIVDLSVLLGVSVANEAKSLESASDLDRANEAKSLESASDRPFPFSRNTKPLPPAPTIDPWGRPIRPCRIPLPYNIIEREILLEMMAHNASR